MENKLGRISSICGIVGIILVGILFMLMNIFSETYPNSVTLQNIALIFLILSIINLTFPILSIVFGGAGIFKDDLRILGIVGVIIGIISLIIVIFWINVLIVLRESIIIIIPP